MSLTLVMLVIGCAGLREAPQKEAGKVVPPPPPPLRVCTTPDYPPMIFVTRAGYAGIEADLAGLLARELGLEVQYVAMAWNVLITALMEGECDIIMSGMSVTDARRVRIDFTDRYAKTGLLAAMRLKDSQKFTSADVIGQNQPFLTLGVVEGTTGEGFVQKHFPKARRVSVRRASDAVFELKIGRIDFFIHDAPSVVWIVSENEMELTAIWTLLNEEHLAWGVRHGDDALRQRVNEVLAAWKADGTLKRVLTRWLPYYGAIE
jgi:polar amino acid transport system substrate-binding protein